MVCSLLEQAFTTRGGVTASPYINWTNTQRLMYIYKRYYK